jgi:hypothetical protein
MPCARMKTDKTAEIWAVEPTRLITAGPSLDTLPDSGAKKVDEAFWGKYQAVSAGGEWMCNFATNPKIALSWGG